MSPPPPPLSLKFPPHSPSLWTLLLHLLFPLPQLLLHSGTLPLSLSLFLSCPARTGTMKLALAFSIVSLLAAAQGPTPSGASHHHSAAPAPAVDCSSLIMNMADCLSFVSKGSTSTKPEQGCCSGLKTVIMTGAECLCEALKSSAQLGVDLNVSKALTLPSACKLSAPSSANCALSESPAAAPALSPTAGGAPGALSPAAGGANLAAPVPSPGNAAPAGHSLSVGYSVSAVAVGLFLTLKSMRV